MKQGAFTSETSHAFASLALFLFLFPFSLAFVSRGAFYCIPHCQALLRPHALFCLICYYLVRSCL